ncbi:MAG: RelA/SpoT family protein [Chloroflexi bacterium]|jgi:GTP pyrophosphokinase|nr:RelA/SpoT family protein [Chloroflexota bacterium]
MTPTTIVTCEQLFKLLDTYLGPEDRLRVQQASKYARQKHGDQIRKSGEPFFIHPLTVTYYLAQFHLDAQTLMAALLHDVAEDASVPINEIKAQFGSEVASLVDGVTKLKEISEGVAKGRQLSKQEIQDLSTQKLFREMVNDVRVVIIKLFDRLHNMRTIKHMPDDGQKRKARETLYVFAPMANRLGIWQLKSELEALSLEVLNNRAYQIIEQNLEQLREDQQEMFHLVSGQIFARLLEANLDARKVALVPENIYTVYQDLTSEGVAYHELDRTLRLVVLLDDWISCYTAFGHLHQIWQAVPDRFDDYISVPRDNLYRSLHTTVIHDSGQHIKIRLRTEAMDEVSKIGVLARWLYADTPLWDKGIAERIEALSENIRETIDSDYQDPGAMVKMVVEDVFAQQIRVYTPRGDAIELAQGSTPIDFAYAIHTELGDQCQAAKVNEMLSPLNRILRNGDLVQIIKGLRAEPQREWLDEDLGYLGTNYARSHARRWFRRLPKEKVDIQGKQLLQAELRMLGLPRHSHLAVARSFGYKGTENLYHAIGRAELLPTVVATRVLAKKWTEEPVRNLDNMVTAPRGEKYIVTNANGRYLRLCATCEPRPRDNIVGYLRRNGSVTVHREGCHSLRANRTTGRLLKLGWGETTSRKARLITIQVDVYDRPGLLFDITSPMQEEQINIPFICTPATPHPGEMRIVMSLEVESPRQAVRILHQIRALVNVYSVRCLPPDSVTDYEAATTPFYKPE